MDNSTMTILINENGDVDVQKSSSYVKYGRVGANFQIKDEYVANFLREVNKLLNEGIESHIKNIDRKKVQNKVESNEK